MTSFPISSLFSVLGIGYFLGLISIDLIHDLGLHAQTYYIKVLQPSIVTPFMFTILGIFGISSVIRVLNQTSKIRALFRVILLIASAIVFVDVLKTETQLIGVTVGIDEVPVTLAKRILYDHFALAGIMGFLLILEVDSIRKLGIVSKVKQV